MEFDPAAMPQREAYKLLVGSVLPRPIAWVSTLSAGGVPNLAPFSFFAGLSARPMTICFSPGIRGSDGEMKDTLRNIAATGEFVVNVVTEENALAMNETATDFSPEVDEFAACGLTPLPSVAVKPPRVAESPVHMECRMRQLIALGDGPGSNYLVLGHVVRIHVRDDLWRDGGIDITALRPVGRLGGDGYVRVTDRFELKRKPAPGPQSGR